MKGYVIQAKSRWRVLTLADATRHCVVQVVQAYQQWILQARQRSLMMTVRYFDFVGQMRQMTVGEGQERSQAPEQGQAQEQTLAQEQ